MDKSKRRYKDYDESMLNIAVGLVQNKNISSYDAEKQFGIPRRTILNKVKQKHLKSIGGPTKLSAADEQKIANCLILCGEYGYPLTSWELRSIVYDYLVKNGLSGIFNYKMPGPKWVRNFLKRQRNILTVRSTTNIKESRANKSVQDYTTYFENLKISLNNVKSENIVNYDETNFSDNPGSQKCIFKAGTKHPNKTLNSTKTAISVMFSATASGEIFPPYIVYKAENLWTNWCANGPEGARYNRTKSGWFDADTFEDWFNSIIIPWAEKTMDPKVLIGDNLSSHMNVSIISKCQELNIRFIFLPPNSTHHTQPLDVAFFGPLKREWRKILMDYKVRHPSANTLNKQIFPELLKMLLDASKLTQSKNIISGFRAAGIHPINPEVVLKKLPDYCKSQTNISFDETFVNYLKELRFPASKQKRNANKKLLIEPGKSVSASDLLHKKPKKRNHPDATVSKSKKPKVQKERTIAESHQSVEDTSRAIEQWTVDDTLPNIRRSSSSDIDNNEHVLTVISAEVHLADENMESSNQTHNNNILKIPSDVIVNVDKNLRLSKNKSLFRDVSNINATTPTEDDLLENHILSNIRIKSPDVMVFDDDNTSLSHMKQDNVFKKRDNRESSSESSGMYTVHDSSCDGHFLVSNSDTETYLEEINDEMDFEKENKDCEIGIDKYVLVKFTTSKLVKYYIGLVTEYNSAERVYTIKYLRKNSRGKFYWPVVDDTSEITLLDVEKTLSHPQVGRRGELSFDLNNLSVALSNIM